MSGELEVVERALSRREGMTLDELETFVKRARVADAAGTEHVQSRQTARGRIRQVSVTVRV